MATPSEWGRAFALQADADISAWNYLSDLGDEFPACQHLHFLQMACEKLTKAYLCHNGFDPLKIQSSHAYIRKVLPRILEYELAELKTGNDKINTFLGSMKLFAAEIDFLAPSNDDGGARPENCEYPWLNNDKVIVPAKHRFWAADLLKQTNGQRILKMISFAIKRYCDLEDS